LWHPDDDQNMKMRMNITWITTPQAQGIKFILIALLGLFGVVGTGESAYLKFADISEYSVDVGESIYYLFHRNDRLEGQDIYDGLWENAPPAQFPIWLRLSSNPWGKELYRDARPFDSKTPVELSFDVMSRDVPSGMVVCGNYLWVWEINNNDGAFTGKPITFQQKSLTGDPNESYPVFDLRRAYALNGGRVPMYDPSGNTLHLEGIFQNNQVYAKGVVRFDRYLADLNDDKVVDVKDLVLLAGHWMETGFALPGDLSGEFGIPDGRVDLFDLAVMAEEWGVRFVAP
jgi:hypothetical protein